MPGVEKPILLDFPDTFETERLIIRAPRVGDGQAMNDALAESIDNLRPWLPMPWTQKLQSVAETEEYVRRWLAMWMLREDFRLCLIRKSDGLFIGQCGLHRVDWGAMRFEIGYWLRTSLQGQGYISEAVMAVTAFAFNVLKAERVELRCDSLNERSAAVARRGGYTLEGTLRNNYTADNNTAYRDTLVFAMLRAEFQQRNPITKTETSS